MGITTGIVQNKAWKTPLKRLFIAALLVGLMVLLTVACAQDEGPVTQPPSGESSTNESGAEDTVNNRAVPTPESRLDPTPRPVQTRDSVQVQQIPPTAMAMATIYPTPAPELMQYSGATAMPVPTGTPAPAAPRDAALLRIRLMSAQSGQLADPDGEPYPLGAGGTDTVNDAAYDLIFFKHYGVNPFIDTEDDRFSTFAMDVDTASYTVARRFIMDGNLPLPEAVRVEEFVNYFDHGYEPPEEEAFAIHIEGSPSPFGGPNHLLMRVGLKGKMIPADERKDASLIFVIDVSGSMNRGDRLGLVKRSLELLVGQLRPQDKVGIVIYGSRGHVLLEPTAGSNTETIMGAINALRSEGSTNAAEGLELGYRMAEGELHPGRITRVMLLSDGVANVGDTGPDSILKLIKNQVEEGVTLSTVGFGMGNYNDILMEQLANDGNGAYAYVDTLKEAKRLFVENLTGTLQVIALDSKVQVDFNPDVVSRYRLLGYENRRVDDEDFRNDQVDAGEVGAGHSVTALYEVKLREEAQGQMAEVFVRYEDPDSRNVIELSRAFNTDQMAGSFEQSAPTFRLAAVAAELAEILRESYWAQDGSLVTLAQTAADVHRLFPEDADVAELVRLIEQASGLWTRG